jgi:uncharacterized OsmC-like protein
MTSIVTYQGSLRTTCVHKAGEQITTDAPLDNHGMGAYFSPTDLVATALASCFLTIVGIYCDERKIPFNTARVEVEKIMASNPRRISDIRLSIDFNGNDWDEKTLSKIIAAGKSCPVAITLKDQVNIEYHFK